MAQLQSTVGLGQSMPRPDLNPDQQDDAMPTQAPQLRNSRDIASKFTSMMHSVTSQPGLTDVLEEKYRDMGLGLEISAALQ